MSNRLVSIRNDSSSIVVNFVAFRFRVRFVVSLVVMFFVGFHVHDHLQVSSSFFFLSSASQNSFSGKSVSFSVKSVESLDNLGPTLRSISSSFFGRVIRISVLYASFFASRSGNPVYFGVIDNFGNSTFITTTTWVAWFFLFNRNIFVFNVRNGVYDWGRNSNSFRNRNIIYSVVVYNSRVTRSYFRFGDGIQSFLNIRSSLVVNLYLFNVLARHDNWLFYIKVTRSSYVLGSASIFDLSSLSNGLSFVSLFRRVNPLNINLLGGVVRFNEVSVDNNISWDGNLSSLSIISGLNWHMSSRKSSSDILRRNHLNLFSVVVNMRFDESSIVSNVTRNGYSSVLNSGSSLNRFGNDISFFNSVLSLYKNRVKVLGNFIYIRLNDNLLSGRFNKGVGDISGRSNYSFGDYFRFFNDSVDNHLRLGVYSFHLYILGSKGLLGLFADDG